MFLLNWTVFEERTIKTLKKYVNECQEDIENKKGILGPLFILEEKFRLCQPERVGFAPQCWEKGILSRFSSCFPQNLVSLGAAVTQRKTQIQVHFWQDEAECQGSSSPWLVAWLAATPKSQVEHLKQIWLNTLSRKDSSSCRLPSPIWMRGACEPWWEGCCFCLLRKCADLQQARS